MDQTLRESKQRQSSKKLLTLNSSSRRPYKLQKISGQRRRGNLIFTAQKHNLKNRQLIYSSDLYPLLTNFRYPILTIF